MQLFLVQHGEAKTKAEDPERPLSDRGAHMVEQMAIWASRAGLEISQIRHSGKRRAQHTAEILARHLKPANGVTATGGLEPNDDVRPIAATLKAEAESVMLVGHLPFLSRLVGLLVAADADAAVVRFTNAGIVCLHRDEGRWLMDWALPPQLAL